MKVKYDVFIAENSLPDLRQWVDLEDEVTVWGVRSALHEKLSFYADVLHNMLFPEAMASLSESAMMSEQEHEKALALYNDVMLLIKECVLADIESSPKEDLALVKKTVALMPSFALRLKPLVEKTKSAYNGHKKTPFSASYLG